MQLALRDHMRKLLFLHAAALTAWENSDFRRPFVASGPDNRTRKSILSVWKNSFLSSDIALAMSFTYNKSTL